MLHLARGRSVSYGYAFSLWERHYQNQQLAKGRTGKQHSWRQWANRILGEKTARRPLCRPHTRRRTGAAHHKYRRTGLHYLCRNTVCPSQNHIVATRYMERLCQQPRSREIPKWRYEWLRFTITLHLRLDRKQFGKGQHQRYHSRLQMLQIPGENHWFHEQAQRCLSCP